MMKTTVTKTNEYATEYAKHICQKCEKHCEGDTRACRIKTQDDMSTAMYIYYFPLALVEDEKLRLLLEPYRARLDITD